MEQKKISPNIKARVVFTIFFSFYLVWYMICFSLSLFFTEQQGESLPHLFEVFGGSHLFGPKMKKKNSAITSVVPRLSS